MPFQTYFNGVEGREPLGTLVLIVYLAILNRHLARFPISTVPTLAINLYLFLFFILPSRSTKFEKSTCPQRAWVWNESRPATRGWPPLLLAPTMP